MQRFTKGIVTHSAFVHAQYSAMISAGRKPAGHERIEGDKITSPLAVQHQQSAAELDRSCTQRDSQRDIACRAAAEAAFRGMVLPQRMQRLRILNDD